MSSRSRPIKFKVAIVLLLPLLTILALSAVAVGHVFGREWIMLDLAAGAVGLVAAVASLVIAVRVMRRPIVEARGLTAGVYDFSNRRLPMIAERVRQGIETHGSFEAPQYSFTTREVEALYDAFVIARDAAVKATMDEGMLRKGIGEVFVNLARRSQALLHRQLRLLDAMERRVTEADELDDLFRLDHLATRMRRHAEGLVILSGRAPARGWRNPVPFVDVARGAVAEVEDYTRVAVAPMPGCALAGRAVADIIHLLAEMIENATSFSPPHTSVQVTGQLVGNGFVLEVEDRGLGLSPERLAAINQLLLDPPEFDLSESARLGLFVVGHLAKRHGVRVSLRPSPYGGTTAIILIPMSLVVDSDTPNPEQASEQPPEHAAVGAAAPANQMAAGAAAPSPGGTPSGAGHLRPAPPGVRSDPGQPGGRPPTQGRHAQRPPRRTSADSPADGELPRRVRQQSLAPQLRDEPSDEASGDPSNAGNDRSPEEVRATMAALQNGWLRGRSETSAAAEGPARSGERPTKEEDA